LLAVLQSANFVLSCRMMPAPKNNRECYHNPIQLTPQILKFGAYGIIVVSIY